MFIQAFITSHISYCNTLFSSQYPLIVYRQSKMLLQNFWLDGLTLLLFLNLFIGFSDSPDRKPAWLRQLPSTGYNGLTFKSWVKFHNDAAANNETHISRCVHHWLDLPFTGFGGLHLDVGSHFVLYMKQQWWLEADTGYTQSILIFIN